MISNLHSPRLVKKIGECKLGVTLCKQLIYWKDCQSLEPTQELVKAKLLGILLEFTQTKQKIASSLG